MHHKPADLAPHVRLQIGGDIHRRRSHRTSQAPTGGGQGQSRQDAQAGPNHSQEDRTTPAAHAAFTLSSETTRPSSMRTMRVACSSSRGSCVEKRNVMPRSTLSRFINRSEEHTSELQSRENL